MKTKLIIFLVLTIYTVLHSDTFIMYAYADSVDVSIDKIMSITDTEKRYKEIVKIYKDAGMKDRLKLMSSFKELDCKYLNIALDIYYLENNEQLLSKLDSLLFNYNYFSSGDSPKCKINQENYDKMINIVQNKISHVPFPQFYALTLDSFIKELTRYDKESTIKTFEKLLASDNELQKGFGMYVYPLVAKKDISEDIINSIEHGSVYLRLVGTKNLASLKNNIENWPRVSNHESILKVTKENYRVSGDFYPLIDVTTQALSSCKEAGFDVKSIVEILLNAYNNFPKKSRKFLLNSIEEHFYSGSEVFNKVLIKLLEIEEDPKMKKLIEWHLSN